jgi:hypothetical protein
MTGLPFNRLAVLLSENGARHHHKLAAVDSLAGGWVGVFDDPVCKLEREDLFQFF